MLPFIIQNEKSLCFGCRACEQACKLKAIEMHLDDEGFLYPKINYDLCKNCGQCSKVCPRGKTLNPILENEPLVFAAWNKDEKVRQTSTSGGIFHSIAKYTIERNGIVFGSIYTKNWDVIHTKASTIDDLKSMQGAKYVQSDTMDSFSQVKKLLQENISVYYTGTPCQIAGLKHFLEKSYANLITSDLICHGVPSITIFKKQIESIEKIFKKKLLNIDFRNKEKFGWGCHLKLSFQKNKSIHMDSLLNPYSYGFYKNLILRPSCYKCPFSTKYREGDITLGDFWGFNKIFKNIKTGKGISLILVNTERGKSILEKSISDIYLIKSNIQSAISYNGQLKHSSSKPKNRELIFKEFQTLSFQELSNKYFKLSKKDTYKIILKNFIKKISLNKYWK